MKVFGEKRKRIQFSWRDTGIAIGIMLITTFITAVMNVHYLGGVSFIPMLYLLAVFLVSLCTEGFLYGIVSSVLGVFFINYAYTYPFYSFDFTPPGYPVTFAIMITVSLLTCTMTSNLKQQEKLKLEMEKEKMRANLLRSISHDLRTPMTSIIGVINTIVENDDKIDASKRIMLLKDAKEDAEWLVRLVENLLLVTKISSSKAELQVEDEVVEEIVAEAVQKFHKHFPGQKVEVKVPEDVLLVPMDGILIEEVLNNLIENSIKHAGESDKIDLYVTHDSEYAYFTVRDYGKGFPDESIEKLFQGYLLSSDKENSDGSKNMGIGLSLCSSIILAHNGRMNANNAKEGGAEVSFSLPLRKEK